MLEPARRRMPVVPDAKRLLSAVARRRHPSTRASNASAGERVRGALHIQTGQPRHSQIKGFLRSGRHRHQDLDSYLRWFHLIELGDQPSPRACLEAAMAKPYLRFAN